MEVFIRNIHRSSNYYWIKAKKSLRRSTLVAPLNLMPFIIEIVGLRIDSLNAKKKINFNNWTKTELKKLVYGNLPRKNYESIEFIAKISTRVNVLECREPFNFVYFPLNYGYQFSCFVRLSFHSVRLAPLSRALSLSRYQ